MRRWSKEEIEYLKENYPKKTAKEISKEIGRNTSSVMHKARELGLCTKRRRWSKEEKEFVKKNYKKMTAKEVAKKLRRSEHSIKYIASELGIRKITRLSKEEIEYILRNKNKTRKEIAKEIEVKPYQVGYILKKYGLVEPKKRWSKEEIEIIMKHKDKDAQEIAEMIGRSREAVARKRLELGIRKQRRWKKEEIEFITKNAKRMTAKEIAKTLNSPVERVRALLYKKGIKAKRERMVKDDKEVEEVARMIVDHKISVAEAKKMLKKSTTLSRKVIELIEKKLYIAGKD